METNNNTSNNVRIEIGAHMMLMSDEVMNKLNNIKESEYMLDEVDKMTAKLIDIYKESEFEGKFFSAKEAMDMISTLADMKADYKFLTKLEITEVEQEEIEG